MQPTLDFGTVGRIAIGAEDKADVTDRGTRRRLRPGKGIDVFPHEVPRRRHFEDAAPQAFANERVARPQPLTAGDEKAVEGVAGIALIFPYRLAGLLIELNDFRATRPAFVAIGKEHHMPIVEELNIVRATPGIVLPVPGKLVGRPVDNGDQREMTETTFHRIMW